MVPCCTRTGSNKARAAAFSPARHGKVLAGKIPLNFVPFDDGVCRIPWCLGRGCNFFFLGRDFPRNGGEGWLTWRIGYVCPKVVFPFDITPHDGVLVEVGFVAQYGVPSTMDFSNLAVLDFAEIGGRKRVIMIDQPATPGAGRQFATYEEDLAESSIFVIERDRASFTFQPLVRQLNK